MNGIEYSACLGLLTMCVVRIGTILRFASILFEDVDPCPWLSLLAFLHMWLAAFLMRCVDGKCCNTETKTVRSCSLKCLVCTWCIYVL